MKLTKTKLRNLIREEIRLINEQYFKTKQLKPGMMVMHKDWDHRTSEPMKVVKIKGKQ